MTPRQLQKLKRILQDMRIAPRGRKSADMEALAVALGRRRHARDLKVATARSIIDVLLNDVAIREDYLQEVEDDN